MLVTLSVYRWVKHLNGSALSSITAVKRQKGINGAFVKCWPDTDVMCLCLPPPRLLQESPSAATHFGNTQVAEWLIISAVTYSFKKNCKCDIFSQFIPKWDSRHQERKKVTILHTLEQIVWLIKDEMVTKSPQFYRLTQHQYLRHWMMRYGDLFFSKWIYNDMQFTWCSWGITAPVFSSTHWA